MLPMICALAVVWTARPPTGERVPPVLSATVERSIVKKPWLVDTIPPAVLIAPVLPAIVESAICVQVSGVTSAPPTLSTPPPRFVSIRLWAITSRPPVRFATPPALELVTRTWSSVAVP